MRLLLFIIVLLSFTSHLKATETKLPDHQWQSFMGGSQQILSVHHKMIGVNRNYKAEFIVHNKDAKEIYYADLLINSDDWGRVLFPDDFRKRDESSIWNLHKGGNFI